jgi:hypothetical protein
MLASMLVAMDRMTMSTASAPSPERLLAASSRSFKMI